MRFYANFRAMGLAMGLAFTLTAPGVAQNTSSAGPAVGPETGFALPRYVSVKASKARVRQGPSRDHRIEWLFAQSGVPVRVTAEHEHWRRIEDATGASGWMHYTLLSGRRQVMVTAPRIALLEDPAEGAPTIALADEGVIARLGDCVKKWCQITADGVTGWAHKKGLWGVDPDEIRKK